MLWAVFVLITNRIHPFLLRTVIVRSVEKVQVSSSFLFCFVFQKERLFHTVSKLSYYRGKWRQKVMRVKRGHFLCYFPCKWESARSCKESEALHLGKMMAPDMAKS